MQTHEFNKNLLIRVSDPHDIIIMKSATSREKDIDDIKKIVTSSSMNWDILVEEAGVQVKLGNELAILSLGEKLETLENLGMIKVPKSAADKLWKMLKKQVKGKRK